MYVYFKSIIFEKIFELHNLEFVLKFCIHFGLCQGCNYEFGNTFWIVKSKIYYLLKNTF